MSWKLEQNKKITALLIVIKNNWFENILSNKKLLLDLIKLKNIAEKLILKNLVSRFDLKDLILRKTKKIILIIVSNK